MAVKGIAVGDWQGFLKFEHFPLTRRARVRLCDDFPDQYRWKNKYYKAEE
jgi:hypothetical protein